MPPTQVRSVVFADLNLDDPRRTKSSPGTPDRKGGAGGAGPSGANKPAGERPVAPSEPPEPHWSTAIDSATD
jgi:hypothetical protein